MSRNRLFENLDLDVIKCLLIIMIFQTMQCLMPARQFW